MKHYRRALQRFLCRSLAFIQKAREIKQTGDEWHLIL